MKQYTFRKPEHLCLKSEIEALFSSGCKSMSVFPLRVTFRRFAYTGQGPQVKVLLSVSKRQLREAYRHLKPAFLASLPDDVALHIAFIWLSDRPVRTDLVATRMQTALQRISEKVMQQLPS